MRNKQNSSGTGHEPVASSTISLVSLSKAENGSSSSKIGRRSSNAIISAMHCFRRRSDRRCPCRAAVHRDGTGRGGTPTPPAGPIEVRIWHGSQRAGGYAQAQSLRPGPVPARHRRSCWQTANKLHQRLGPDDNLPLYRHNKSHQGFQQCGFARTGRTGDASFLPGFDIEIKPLK